jgi:membrane associated rhomboid family serine protease
MAWSNNENKLKACQSCRALIPANAAECESCGAAGHHAVSAGSAGSLSDPLEVLGAWPVTMILMLVNVVVYAWVLIYQMQFSGEGGAGNGFAFEPIRFPDVLGAFGSVSAPEVRGAGEWWRLLAYAFLHGGVLHLGMNMYGLWQAGRMAEELLGRTQYLVLYVLSGIGGGLVIIAGNTSAVGASGSLFGVIAGLWAHSYRRDSVLGKGFQQYMMMWLLYGVAMSFSPRVSWQGHLGGALVGAALAFFVLPAEDLFRQSMRRVRIMQAVAVLCLLAVLVTFGFMARNLGTARESSVLQESTKRLFYLTLNVERLGLAAHLAQGAKQPSLISSKNLSSFQKSFVAWFEETPDKISDEKIDEVLMQGYKAVCADVGTLERMALPDAEFAQIRDSMHATLQMVCAKPAFNTKELAQTKDLPIDDVTRAFRRDFQSCWRWAEGRAARQHQRLEKLLLDDLAERATSYLISIETMQSETPLSKPAR